MPDFKIVSDFVPTGDQPEAIDALVDGIDAAAVNAGIPHTIARVGSMFTLFFNPEPVTDYEIAAASDTDRFAAYFHGMLDAGIYLPCSQFEANFVSTAHTDQDLEATIEAANDVLGALGSETRNTT